MSSSEGLRIKSTKALLEVFVGQGGGWSSMAQNQFLANPCWSRLPWLLNCKQRASILEHKIWDLIVIAIQFLKGHLKRAMKFRIHPTIFNYMNNCYVGSQCDCRFSAMEAATKSRRLKFK